MTKQKQKQNDMITLDEAKIRFDSVLHDAAQKIESLETFPESVAESGFGTPNHVAMTGAIYKFGVMDTPPNTSK